LGIALGLTINFGMEKFEWGWRLCYAILGVLAFPLFLIFVFA